MMQRVRWMRSFYVSMGLVGLSVACAPEGSRRQPDEGIDEPNATTSADAGGSEASTLDNEDARVNDASDSTSASGANASQTSGLDASNGAQLDASPSGPNSFHDRDARVEPQPSLDAGSPIIDPNVETLDVAALCEGAWDLQGRVIETNLAGHVTLGAWHRVRPLAGGDGGVNAGASEDAGVLGDAGVSGDAGVLADARVCVDEFAPYVVACERGALLVQSPSLVYGSGPTLGGEVVTVGCWARDCEAQCLPSVATSLERVRAQLNPVVPTTPPEGGLPGTTGFVRVNGVEIEVLGTLEITATL